MSIETKLDRLHRYVAEIPLLQVFTVATRFLLFVGFTPPSIIKILNRPFTVLPDSNPVGHYFNALYQTGFYYQFIGWAQLIAAVLLIFPRTAHLGALMFLPIIANIAVLTVSVGFEGTWLITCLMTLAATYLVAWDYDRIKFVFFSSRERKRSGFRYSFVVLPILFAIGGAVTGLTWWAIGLGNFPNYPAVTAVLAAAGVVFGFACAVHLRFMPSGPLKGSD